jgi:hypothetical protein
MNNTPHTPVCVTCNKPVWLDHDHAEFVRADIGLGRGSGIRIAYTCECDDCGCAGCEARYQAECDGYRAEQEMTREDWAFELSMAFANV